MRTTQNSQPRQERAIRIFVSSSFKDMRLERDELAKKVFPQLRALCRERGVIWEDIDLRWGITDEDKAEGKVLPICLAEIERSRPYFIGILGERYGWIPDNILTEAYEGRDWLRVTRDRSVTELEILHGVLNNPDMAEHAYFYFRDPLYVHSEPPKSLTEYTDAPTEEEISQYGVETAQKRAAAKQDKLAALKTKILKSGFPVSENFKDHDDLADLVLADFTALINRLFPLSDDIDPVEAENDSHHFHAVNLRQTFVRNSTNPALNDLDRFATGTCIVSGEPGIGKSALIAKWLDSIQSDDTRIIISHFIGSTPSSTDWAAMLRRIMCNLIEKGEISFDIPAENSGLASAFEKVLFMVAEKKKIIIVIDGLDLLETRDHAHDLVWLPITVPDNVKLVLSASPGTSFQEALRRGYTRIHVDGLDEHERQQFITTYLKRYARKLDKAKHDKIAQIEAASNPLYLRTILRELRYVGDHYELPDNIEAYASAGSVQELFILVINRLEKDHDPEHTGFIHETLKLLWAARYGLSESEVLAILESRNIRIHRRQWSRFYKAADYYFVSRSGLLSFAHAQFKEAVESILFPEFILQQKAYRTLSDYFAKQIPDQEHYKYITEHLSRHDSQEFSHVGMRKMAQKTMPDFRVLTEYPWLCAQSHNWPALFNFLSELRYLEALWLLSTFDVYHYWKLLRENSNYTLPRAYAPVINNPAKVIDDNHIGIVAHLLSHFGHMQEAQKIHNFQGHTASLSGHIELVFNNLIASGHIQRRMGNIDKSFEIYIKADVMARKLNSGQKLAHTSINLAMILWDKGNKEIARQLILKARTLYKRAKDPQGLASTFIDEAITLRSLHEYSESLTLYNEAEKILRTTDARDMLAGCLDNKANILYELGDLSTALSVRQECETYYRNSGDAEYLGLNLANQALLLADLEDNKQAIILLDEAIDLLEKNGFQHSRTEIEPIIQYVRAKTSGIPFVMSIKEGTQSDHFDDYTRARQLFDEGNWLDAEIAFRQLALVELPISQVGPYLIECIIKQHEELSDQQKNEIRRIREQIQKSDNLSKSKYFRNTNES